MGKWKIPLLVLITLVLLGAGASLPKIAAAMQDRTNINQSGFGETESLELSFSDIQADRPLLEKLALIRDGVFYAVSPDKTRISLDEIDQVVKDGLVCYYEAELIPNNWDKYDLKATPHLVYSGADGDIYMILWVVALSWPESGDVLELYVDDETGIILYLHYSTTGSLTRYSDRGYLDALSNAYCAATGLSEILADPASFGTQWVTFDDSGMNTQNDKFYCYSVYHPDYGNLSVRFWLYQNGFYTVICEN